MPGFTPRPSLSDPATLAAWTTQGRVAGVHAPAFVERSSCWTICSVVRVLPGFTPRPSLSADRRQQIRRDGRVLPGFTPRPSLSVGRAGCVGHQRPGVAGVHAPAFVERASGPSRANRRDVLPGFTPRPSLSVEKVEAAISSNDVLPGFTPRPSLSVPTVARRLLQLRGVAGVHAPAFVERPAAGSGISSRPSRVAGVHAPAFVERAQQRQGPHQGAIVLPGFTPRPSLSVDRALRLRSPIPVLPGFTPRPSLSDLHRRSQQRAGAKCCRGSRPGLR